MQERHHITVCICTYQRPQLLARLLKALERQKTGGLFTYSVAVVDNDRRETGRRTVEEAAATGSIPVQYDVEPEQNIALARNRAVRNATGTHIAFLDDDERPIDTWLLSLYRTCRTCAADGALGPVKPEFPTPPPAWIVKGRICERTSHATGTVLRHYTDTRTGNVLFDSSIFTGEDRPFDPHFGRTGGEDTDFFRRMLSRGRTFVWCNEAEAYEMVPPERLTRSYYLRRALLRGTVAFRQPTLRLKAIGVVKSLAAVTLYTPLLLVLLATGSHLFMRYLIKYCDHLGKLMAAVGLTVIKERSGETVVLTGRARAKEAVRE
jgi:glycosyltransferase involved in cell wall biosynthesis